MKLWKDLTIYTGMAHYRYKCHEALIDREGTHFLFHKMSSLNPYEEILDKKEAVRFLTVMGRETVLLPIYGGNAVEGCHSSHFLSNILSVGQISYLFETCFNSEGTVEGKKKSFCIRKRQGNNKMILIEEIEDVLYTLKIRV